jgi:CBS domain containing-hemolysin-like protein
MSDGGSGGGRPSRNPGGNGAATKLQAIRNLFGRRRRGSDEALRDAIEELIEDEPAPENAGDAVRRDERHLILNVLKLRERTAVDVMVPRADIVASPLDQPLDGLVRLMLEQGHSRVPVFRETLDDVIGFVHIRDVLACAAGERPFDLRELCRSILFVAPSMPALDLLLDMQLKRQHIALVIDEFGGIDGLVTLEDVVEEIVGDIADEYDIEEGPKLIRRPDGTLIADARATIEEFEQEVGPILTDEERDEDIDTIGGFVFSLIGRVPARGELVTHETTGIAFEVIDADPRRIKRMRVRNLPIRATEDSAEG